MNVIVCVMGLVCSTRCLCDGPCSTSIFTLYLCHSSTSTGEGIGIGGDTGERWCPYRFCIIITIFPVEAFPVEAGGREKEGELGECEQAPH